MKNKKKLSSLIHTDVICLNRKSGLKVLDAIKTHGGGGGGGDDVLHDFQFQGSIS